MELIKVARVENVQLLHQGIPSPGTLHITPHHLIFSHAPPRQNSYPENDQNEKPAPVKTPEVWITYPIIFTVERKYMGNPGGLERNVRAASELSLDALADGTSTSGGVRKQQALTIRLRCRDFTFITLCFENDKSAKDVFDSIKNLTCRDSVEKLYAFTYKPGKPEKLFNGWNLYNPQKEFQRQGITSDWRLSKINNNYTFCDTYPSNLYVPASITDNTLGYAAKYRSRQRAPVLTYIHSVNNCTITRSSQPLTGVRGNRSIQDEKLVAQIFASSNASSFLKSVSAKSSSSTSLVSMEGENGNEEKGQTTKALVYGAQQTNLIVDARPLVNAVAQQAVGAGSENMDNYRFGKKEYLGIDNIHVMRDSLNKVIEGIKDSDITPFPANRDLLAKSNWLKHIAGLLEGTNLIARQVGLEHSHVLIHCSDGWDRTSQLSALSQICLDPYFRTLEGFMILVEKDWVSFGHKFVDRCGFLSSEKWFSGSSDSGSGPSAGVAGLEHAFGAAKMFFNNQSNNFRSSGSENGEVDNDVAETSSPKKTKAVKHHETKVKETSPVFHQFLDATYQLLQQHPTRFQFNERFLRRLLYHLYSCQYGTFLYNNERERKQADINKRTRSVWDYFLARKEAWLNPEYDEGLNEDERGQSGRLIFPDGKRVRWWWEAFGRKDEEMNGKRESKDQEDLSPVKRDGPTVIVEDASGQYTTSQKSSSSSIENQDTGADEGTILTGAASLGTEKAATLAEAINPTLDAPGSFTPEDAPIISKGETDEPFPEKIASVIAPRNSPLLNPPSSQPIAIPALPSINLSHSVSESPVIVPSSHTSSTSGSDFPVADSYQDPLGGHTAVDLDISLSPRKHVATRFAVASRSRSRGSNFSRDSVESLNSSYDNVNKTGGSNGSVSVNVTPKKKPVFEELEMS